MMRRAAFASPTAVVARFSVLRPQQTCRPARRPAATMTASAVASRASTALITGASGGIGAETAVHLRSVLPSLDLRILAARDTDEAERVAGRVRAASAGAVDVSVVPVELDSIASARACAAAARGVLGSRPLDLLVNNAGVMACPLMYTQDGLELQYGVNHVGHAALTMELLPQLRQSEAGRIVFVSSMAVAMAVDRKAAASPSSKMHGVVDAATYSKVSRRLSVDFQPPRLASA
jgi:NAD(P)-dependent dehydrogenase (short-subunit alcohol dehydrogenase family)